MGSTIGKIGNFFTKDLTHTGVTGPDGTTFYSTPQQATQAASASLPSADSMIGGDFQNPSVVNTPTNLPIVQATSPTTKGAIFATLIRSGLGGLAGAGAPTAGQGALQAMHLLNSIDEQRRLNEQNALITQMQKARLAEEPGRLRLQGAELANTEAQTAYHRKQLELAGRKEPKSPTAVDLALMAASDDPEQSAFGRKALDELHRSEFKDKTPSSYPALVTAYEIEPDPAKRAAYGRAIDHYERYNNRPNKPESEAEQDRRINRQAGNYAATVLGKFGNDQDKAAAHITSLLSNDAVAQGKHLSEFERNVAAKAVWILRKNPTSLADTLAAMIQGSKNPAPEQ